MAKCPICGKFFTISFIKGNDGTQVCSDEHKIQYNKIMLSKGNSSNNPNNSYNEKKSESSVGNLASGVGSGVGSVVSELGSLSGKGWDSLNKHLDKGVNDNKQKRNAIEEKANSISKIELGNTKESIQNQLEELIAFGSTLKSEQQPIKKAVYTKTTFGIMRLKNIGENEIAVFFENEAEKIKPKWYDSIWFWMTFSNT